MESNTKKVPISKELIEALRNSKEFNPLSLDFAPSFIDDWDSTSDYSNFIDFLVATNNTFLELLKGIRYSIQQLGRSREDLVEFLFSTVEGKMVEIKKSIEEQIAKNSHQKSIEGNVFLEIPSKASESGSVQADSAIESMVDEIGWILTNFHYFDTSIPSITNTHDSQSNEKVIYEKLRIMVNMILAYQSAIELLSHDNGILYLDEENRYFIGYNNELVPILRSIAILREINSRTQFHAIFEGLLRKSHALKKGAKPDGINTMHSQLLAMNLEDALNSPIFEMLVTLSASYGAILDAEVVILDRMRLDRIMMLFCYIQELALADQTAIGGGSLIRKPNSTKSKGIKSSTLLKYLKERSGESDNTIEAYLRGITSSFGDTDLWKKPLFRGKHDRYHFMIPTLDHPNLSIVIDHVLQHFGQSLDLLIKPFVDSFENDVLDNPNAKYPIVSRRILTSAGLDYIQFEINSTFINLFPIWLPFPTSSTEYFEARVHITKTTKKIKSALEGNVSEADQGESPKETKNFIVTNQKHYSSMKIGGIPIVDSLTVSNFLHLGKLVLGGISYNQKDQSPFTFEGAQFPYYESEEEMHERMVEHFLNPFAIWEKIPRFFVAARSCTVGNFLPKIYREIAERHDERRILENIIKLIRRLLAEHYLIKEDERKESEIVSHISKHINFLIFTVLHEIALGADDNRVLRNKTINLFEAKKTVGFVHLIVLLQETLTRLFRRPIGRKKSIQRPNGGTAEELERMMHSLDQYKGKQVRLSQIELASTHDPELELRIAVLIGHHFEDNGFVDPSEGPSSSFPLLLLLRGISNRNECKDIFYLSVGNYIEHLILNRHTQTARDLCEEILVCAIQDGMPEQGWLQFFRTYSKEHLTFEAAFYGILLFTSLERCEIVPSDFAVDALLLLQRFFRDAKLYHLEIEPHEILKQFDLNSYDKQRTELVHFQCKMFTSSDFDEIAAEIISYLNQNIEAILEFDHHGCGPWFVMCENLLANGISPDKRKKAIHFRETFLQKLPKEWVEKMSTYFSKDSNKLRQQLAVELSNLFSTRSRADLSYEMRLLTQLAEQCLHYGIAEKNFDAILLAGLTLNDSLLGYQGIDLPIDAFATLFQTERTDLIHKHLSNYQDFLRSNLGLQERDVLVWFFVSKGITYCISIDSKKTFFLDEIGSFQKESKRDLNELISGMEFIEGWEVNQEDEYNKHLKRFEYAKIPNRLSTFQRMLAISSIQASSFPPNLFGFHEQFAIHKIPVALVHSFEYYLKAKPVYLDKATLAIEAWIPTSKDTTLLLAHSLLEETFKEYDVKCSLDDFPENPLSGQINIVMAHGDRGGDGFVAIFTDDETAILDEDMIIGDGKIAILFVCHSGSMQSEVFSESIASLAFRLIARGYETVIAPFWAFYFKAPGAWLSPFLRHFMNGEDVASANFHANQSMLNTDLHSPAASAAMHVYGNPNAYVQQAGIFPNSG